MGKELTCSSGAEKLEMKLGVHLIFIFHKGLDKEAMKGTGSPNTIFGADSLFLLLIMLLAHIFR